MIKFLISITSWTTRVIQWHSQNAEAAAPVSFAAHMFLRARLSVCTTHGVRWFQGLVQQYYKQEHYQ